MLDIVTESPRPHRHEFFAAGEMGRTIQEFDWERSALGAMHAWPEPLRFALRLMLASREPMCLWWGDERINLHNDACHALLGANAMAALGAPAHVAWSHVWSRLGAAADAALRRCEGFASPPIAMPLERDGVATEAHFSISAAPVGNEASEGLLCTLIDRTAPVVAERHIELLRELAARARGTLSVETACVRAIEGLATDPFDIPFAGIYLVEAGRSRALLTAATGVPAGHAVMPSEIALEAGARLPIVQALASGEIHRIDLTGLPEPLPPAAWMRPIREGILTSLGPVGDGRDAVLVAALCPLHPLDEALRRFLQVVAAQLSAGLANAQALDEERRRLEADTLHEVARDLASELELQPLVQKVTDAGVRLTGAAFGAFFYNIVSEAGDSFELFTLSGAPRSAFESFGMPRATPVFKPTFLGHGPIRVADITRDPRYGKVAPHHGLPKDHLPVRSYLAVPVVSRTGEVLGGLFFGHGEPGMFDLRAERNAVGIAAHAAVAIDNANLYGRARKEIERRASMERDWRRDEAELAATKDELAAQVESLTMMHELAMKLGAMTDLRPAMQAILDTAVNAQDAQMGIVWLQDPENGDLTAEASHGFQGESLLLFQRVPSRPAGGSAGNAFHHQRRWVVADTESDATFAPYREAARKAGFRAVHSTPIVTRSGALLGVLSVHYAACRMPSQRDRQVADVCARHAADAVEALRSQEALRESERLYRAIGESIDYGVWIADAEGRNTYTSDSFLKLLGVSQETWSLTGWDDIVHPEDSPALASTWRACVKSGEQLDQEFRVRCLDGKYRAVLVRGVPVRNARGSVVAWAGIHLDIQRLKQVENELRELDQRKNEFLATLAHELRNPLAPLRNGLEVMRLASGSPQTVEKARSMMERQLGQMVRLVDDLLDVSRVSRGKIELRRERVELASVLRNALETSQPLMDERGHTFIVDIPPERIVVEADTTRLAQVFWNLLNNAAKYTEAAGRVQLSVHPAGEQVEVRIRDNGVGIPLDMQAQVFDIFTQVDRSLEKAQGGLGIGLSIAKRLVEMHGGSISVTSGGHRQGSEFTVRLPAKIEARGVDDHGPAQFAAPCGPRRRILVADDNPDSATTLSLMLEVMGHEVRIARDGQEAVVLAATFQPEAILLDIGMPKMNGYDACRRIRGEPWAQRALIVALTGWGQDGDKNRSKDAGFDRHLVKPVEPMMLEKLIRALPVRAAEGR
jgi:PAS domain S-box-containing protein